MVYVGYCVSKCQYANVNEYARICIFRSRLAHHPLRNLIGKVLLDHVYTWIDGVFYPRPKGEARPDHDLSKAFQPTDSEHGHGFGEFLSSEDKTREVDI